MRPLKNRANEQATHVLDMLNIRQPADIDVELIAAHHNVFVRYRTLQQQEGHLLRAKNAALLVVNDKAKHSNKWRFVIAHELGHFFLHPEHDQFPICTQQDLYAWYHTSGLEREANDFAAQLLMPDHLFVPICDQFGPDGIPSLFHISTLAQTFQTSLTAMAIRFIQHTNTSCAIVHARHGRIDWWVASSSFGLKIRPRRLLGRHTHARALFEGKHIPNEPLPSEIDAWSKTRGPRRLLFEHSFLIREHHATMTLLCCENL